MSSFVLLYHKKKYESKRLPYFRKNMIIQKLAVLRIIKFDKNP